MLRLSPHSRAISVWALFAAPAVLACGPFFPGSALDQPRGILQPPLFHFQSELNFLPLPDKLVKAKPGTPAYTLELELAEVEEIMAAHPDRDAWLEKYRDLRRAMIFLGDDSDQKMEQPERVAARGWESVKRDLESIIAPLPDDVRLYLRGAAAWLDAKAAQDAALAKSAREHWLRLLALPPEKRPHRSTWAAWMLFRASGHDDQGRWLLETRNLSRAGFADCLHLGIEAAYILGRPASDYSERVQVRSAEWKRCAMLRAVLGHSRMDENLRHDRRVFTDWSEDFANEVMADEFLRRVQMLHLIESAHVASGWENGFRSTSQGGWDIPKWLDSFEKAGIRNQKEAVLLAWITYNAAQFEAARRWLALAPADDINALALRGKLAAMRGERREAERNLKLIAAKISTPEPHARAEWEIGQSLQSTPLRVQNYPEVRHHKLLADLGVAQVSRNDFAGALNTFLRSDYHRDAAYVAERLLSVEELLALSRSGKLPKLAKLSVPDTDPPPKPMTIGFLERKYGGWGAPQEVDPFVFLVARRLAREGYFKDACRILPDDLALALQRFASELRRSNDSKLAKAERASAAWVASQIQRRLGMELFGFEGGPDHAFCGGSFELENFARIRAERLWVPLWVTPGDANRHTPVFKATVDELWRARHYGPRHELRFHYRYAAADLAWKAASCLPDDSEATAQILATAGSWLKHRDPKAADRFYKALVNRNPTVPLAREADAKRWFPPVNWEFDLALE